MIDLIKKIRTIKGTKLCQRLPKIMKRKEVLHNSFNNLSKTRKYIQAEHWAKIALKKIIDFWAAIIIWQNIFHDSGQVERH